MKLGRLILIELVIIVLLAAIGGGAYYFYYQGQHYVTSSDAQLGGNLITVVAPATGRVSGSLPEIGVKEQSGARMFAVSATIATTTTQTKTGSTSGSALTTSSLVPVTAPAAGRLASLSIVPGQFVLVGQPVAQIVSEQVNTVTANIHETEINSIHVGQYVDVYVNAYPGDTFPGRVEAIVPATQASLSLLPSTQSSGTFTPVTQRVPVIIRFENPNGARLYMGMSVDVRVHISGNQ